MISETRRALLEGQLNSLAENNHFIPNDLSDLLALQYTDTQEEFCVALKQLGLSSNYIKKYQENGQNTIDKVRNKIRHQAILFNLSEESPDFSKMSPQEWIKKRLQLKTKHDVSLELSEKEQDIIAKQFKEIPLLPELDHYVISSLY